MPNPRLATRYAKSLIDLALEQGKLEEVYADMLWLQSVCKTNRDFVNVLRSPVIKPDIKKKIVEAITTGRIDEMTAAFIRLIITKGRESNLPEISSAFVESYKEKKNIHTIKLTTAAPVDDATRNSIINQIKESSGYENVQVEESIDEDLIGGFVLQIGDRLVDASIAYDLRAIAKQFDNNDFIYKLR